MTYKHAHNPQSETARSLEKIALEKGLIVPENPTPFTSPLQALQTAQALSPTENLSENVIKLCSGLRSQGLTKYADTIETKFMEYKKANAYYDLWGPGEPRTGEQVLYQAHPDGSHKMENVDGDATIEDLLEKQKKIQQVVFKQPTGKLAAKDAVNVARIILAQDTQSIQQLLIDTLNFTLKAIQVATIDGSMYEMNINWAKERAKVIQGVATLDENMIGAQQLDDVKGAIEDIQRVFQPDVLHNYLPNVLTKGIGDTAAWTKANAFLTAALTKVQAAKDQLINKLTPTEEKAPITSTQTLPATVSPAYAKAQSTITDNLKNLDDWKSAVDQFSDAADKQAGTQWIEQTKEKLTHLLDGVSPQSDVATLDAKVLPSLQAIEKDMQTFYAGWVK